MRLAHAFRHGDSPGDDALARLVPRVAQGDERALEELYAATSGRVFGLALRILRDRPSAEEAVVDVYAQVWRQAERYDASKGSVASWITTLARTRSIDLSRREFVAGALTTVVTASASLPTQAHAATPSSAEVTHTVTIGLKVNGSSHDLKVDSRTTLLDGSAIHLTRTEFDLLTAMMENPERVCTREMLLERVWGEWFGDTHVVEVHMSRLRNKVTAAGGPKIGTVVRGVGWRLGVS